tara:strand:- start:41 stop:427 length:387 start_codon:yes stop_codon:yes gene_type:complete
MLPKWHILFGVIFSLILFYIFPIIGLFNLSLIFLSSFLIDFDHYFWYIYKKKDWNLKNSYNYLKKEARNLRKGMVFHTIEFHIFVGLLGLIWAGFFYILIGMISHSLTDLVSLIYEKRLYSRRFSLIF